MNKKGQAAMEFLMTYGWAILVVLVAIGALAYFGVLNPSKFLPNSCTVAPGISCDDFKVTAADVTMVLRNGMGEDITGVTILAPGCVVSAAADLAEGARGTYVSATCTNGAAGDKYKGAVTVAYTSDEGIAHSVAADLITKIE